MIQAGRQLPDSDRISERDREDSYIRWLGHRGRFREIAETLPGLVGRTETVQLLPPMDLLGEYRSSSPSVAMHDGRRAAMVRGVNYRQAVGGITLFDRGEEKCRTRNWWVEFNADWDPIWWKVVEDPYPERPGAVQGYEDCRLFWSNGSWYASCNFAERPSVFGDMAFSLLCEMALIKLSDDAGIEKVWALRGPWSIYHQKNWKPAPTDDEPLRWIYSTEPMVTVTPGMCRDEHHVKWFATSPWRGGSQAIRVPDGWLWVDHRPVIGFDGARNLYIHRFVLADEALTGIVAVSRPFVFRNYGIEFCAGMVVDGERVVLSYSMRDAFSFMAICSLDRVMRSLERV